ncbi:hypothetical protein Daus18300_001085 [Diaporthe australafricana]|uniref:Uncharacterized protein n=1 Tax=Diaporthe australafricana TaxID=127596 RepID=A0ABR3XZS0_9PEZI
MQKLVASTPAIEMERLVPESTELGPFNPNREAGLEPTSGEITPINDGASSITPLSIQEDEPDIPKKDTPLSHRQVAGVAGLFFLFTAAFAASTVLVQSNGNRLTRSDPDLFDPGCIDKLGDAGSPRVTKAFDLDLTFGNFTFTNAKVIDVAWDTAIGQGGRLLHGWILYRYTTYHIVG